MPTTTSKRETIEAWADITIKIFKEKIIALGIIDTGTLLRSLKHHVQVNAEGDVGKIDFFYSYWGHMVDVGAGRNTFTAKRWYGPYFYREAKKLTELLVSKFGIEAIQQINIAINIGHVAA